MAEETKPDDVRLAELKAKTKTEQGLSQVRAMANGKDRDAMLARVALRDRGGKEGQENFPSGSTEMADGGMARGRGGKMYQHNYATGGQVVDHLSKVTGPPMGGQPQSVQAATATVETPAQRSKRLRMGG